MTDRILALFELRHNLLHRNDHKEERMPEEIIEKFKKQREELNRLVMKYAGQGTKRFYSLDSQAYREGALPTKVKELLGLVASFVLRCDDCIKYHTSAIKSWRRHSLSVLSSAGPSPSHINAEPCKPGMN
jgi:alkylhydroperoxidase/carboxymuconolactone decarboxylase family protein YurZ